MSKTWKKVWNSPIFKVLVGITVAVFAPQLLVQFGGAFFGATVGGVTSLSFSGAVTVGALSGFASTGTLKGALTGAFTAGIMFGVGELGNALKDAGFDMASGGIGKVALHAGAGCISSVAGGGSCKTGALSGALGELGNNIPTNDVVLGTVKASMLGGIGAKIGGGKFSDGATTGAFGYLFNELQHTKGTTTERYASAGYEGPADEGVGGVNWKKNYPNTMPVDGNTADNLYCTARCTGQTIQATGGQEKWVDSIEGGKLLHSKNSTHYQNEAVDFRALTVADSKVFSCSRQCGFEAGQWEPQKGKTSPHWHFQLKPGNNVPAIK